MSLVLFIAIVLLTHKYTLVFLAQKYLKENGVTYSKVEGTLFDGVILYNVRYKNIFRVQKLQINYKLMSFIQLKPIIKNIQTQRLYINFDSISNGEKTSSLQLMPFLVLKMKLQDTTFVINHKKYIFTLKTNNLIYDDRFNSNDVFISLHSYYGDANIKAKIDNNEFIGHSNDLHISENVHKGYLHFIASLPKSLVADVIWNKNSVHVRTHISHLVASADKNITLYNQNLKVAYDIQQKKYTFQTDYIAGYKEYFGRVKQRAVVTANGRYNSQIHLKGINFSSAIPVKEIDAYLFGNSHFIRADINASDFFVHIGSQDYKKYNVQLKNKHLQLSFLDFLPQALQKHLFAFEANASVKFSPLQVGGDFKMKDDFASTQATFVYKPTYQKVVANVAPNKKNSIYKDYNVSLLLPLKLTYINEDAGKSLHVSANIFQAYVYKERQRPIEGYGNLASAAFTLKGNSNLAKHLHLKIKSVIPSIRILLKELQMSSGKNETQYDGEVHINTNILFENKFSVTSVFKAPYLSAKTSALNRYVINDVRLRASYEKGVIHIYNYLAHYKGERFYSNKHSLIRVNHNLVFYVDKFYIYNNLLAQGIIDPFNSSMDLNVHSKEFHLLTNNIDVMAKTNINVTVRGSKRQIIDGNVTLLSGSLSYMPTHNYIVEDDDIVIVQDLQRQKQNNLALSIKIDAQSAIKYKTKEINVKFIPHIDLRKKPQEKMKIFGKITILNGSIENHSKEFTFDKSELIFLGTKKVNPELNVKLHYKTVDYKDIVIYISNKLDNPVFVFSSNPAMSQNDIISYILFDEPASTLFDNSEQRNATSLNYLLLGSGIKTLFNQTTGIHVDTLNILNNENGTLGYEVGARLNKRVRVVYKNDITSSMTLQYGLSKSIRVDVDVRDTGQGIYFIYTKDFKGL